MSTPFVIIANPYLKTAIQIQCYDTKSLYMGLVNIEIVEYNTKFDKIQITFSKDAPSAEGLRANAINGFFLYTT